MVKDRLKELRQEMSKRGIDIYIVPTADFHESEYVGEHFKARKFITGFTGSAGTAVITMEEAGLWTDGRYFVQAAKQLKDTTIELRKMGEEGVPTVDEYIEATLKEGGCLGFDGRVINGAWEKDFLPWLKRNTERSMQTKISLILSGRTDQRFQKHLS